VGAEAWLEKQTPAEGKFFKTHLQVILTAGKSACHLQQIFLFADIKLLLAAVDACLADLSIFQFWTEGKFINLGFFLLRYSNDVSKIASFK